MYDVIVIGARCAGSPAAMLLAREGHRVLLVDRATFPSDTMSTHAVKKPAVAALSRWGLYDRLVATGCPPLQHMTFDLGPLRLVGNAPSPEGGPFPYAPRRTVLDQLLVDAASEAGAEVREGYSVQELVIEDGRVVGIRGPSGEVERATLVIGADGRHSMVARAVDAPVYNDVPPLSCWTYGYFADLDVPGVEFYPRGDRMILTFPTNDDRTLVAQSAQIGLEAEIRRDVEGFFNATIAMAPALADRFGKAKRDGRFVTTTDVPNFFRRPYGPGWALVGDAGVDRDPITAEGISRAFQDAELLADAVDAGLTGAQPMEAALAGFEQARNDAAMPLHQVTLLLASLQPLPGPLMELIMSLPGNQDAIDRFFGVIEGTVPPSEVLPFP